MVISSGLVVYCNGRVLMRRGYVNQPNYWELPKGQLEEYDNTVFDCAVRETMEETGFNILDNYHLIDYVKDLGFERYNGVNSNKPSRKVKKKVKFYFVKLLDSVSVENIILGDNDSVEVSWLNINIINNLEVHYTQRRVLDNILGLLNG